MPVYDFTTHRRDKNPKIMYGADILIFEGILSFHIPEISELMDIKASLLLYNIIFSPCVNDLLHSDNLLPNPGNSDIC